MRIRLFWRMVGAAVLMITASVFTGHWAGSTVAQTRPPESEIRPFIGTWTAVHAGTPIIVDNLLTAASLDTAELKVLQDHATRVLYRTAPIPKERLTRNAHGSTTRNRAGRGRSRSGWTAPSLRTTSSLIIGYVLMIFSRPFPASIASLLARPQVLRFCAQICYSSRSLALSRFSRKTHQRATRTSRESGVDSRVRETWLLRRTPRGVDGYDFHSLFPYSTCTANRR